MKGQLVYTRIHFIMRLSWTHFIWLSSFLCVLHYSAHLCHLFLKKMNTHRWYSISMCFHFPFWAGWEQETRGRKPEACLCVRLLFEPVSIHFCAPFMLPSRCTAPVFVLHGTPFCFVFVSPLITDFYLLVLKRLTSPPGLGSDTKRL